ncbi:hypothetical protein N619_18155 [Ectopseudomonas oleovorans]|nr:hypothetical protein N619_18155 [Pseudomonas oleovorans]
MPGMSMLFPVADATLLEGFKPGDRVRVGVRADDEGMWIERIEHLMPAPHGEHAEQEVQP